jgi:phosphoserine phosphatase
LKHLKTAAAGGERAILELVMATHKDRIATAKHPKTGQHYTDMVYQPMLEVLAYLRANGFKTFSISGGGIEFMQRSNFCSR